MIAAVTTTIAILAASLAVVLAAIAAIYARAARDAYRDIRQPKGRTLRDPTWPTEIVTYDGEMTDEKLAEIKARFRAHYPDRPAQ